MAELREAETVDLWTLPIDVPQDWLEGGGRRFGAEDLTRIRRAVTPQKQRERQASLMWQAMVRMHYCGAEHGSLRHGSCLSISHSARWILIAASCAGQIGVDIERRRPIRCLEALASRFFSVEEIEGFQAIDEMEREAAFFRTWVRKEAYLKAVDAGVGVPAGLCRFAVSVTPDHPAIRSTELEPGGVSAFSLYDLDTPDGYVGALAVEGTVHRIRYFEWRARGGGSVMSEK